MSEYFRKYIKKDHFPLHYSEIKFKTFFVNCIQQTMLQRQYRQVEDDDWNIYWCEKQYVSEQLDRLRLHPDKRINHFRNFYEICRKDLLSKNVKRFKKQLNKEGKEQEANSYNFLPLTYNLPSEYPIFLQEFKRNKQRQKAIWIMKPIGRSQGKGIFMFRNINEISDWSQMSNQPEPYIVQRYINNPLLIGNKKFDLRIYVLVLSHNPLVVYLYRSGFARFTHYRYDSNDINNYASHLTNVAIQKFTDNYDEQRGGKYQLDKLRLYLISKYGIEQTEKCFYQIQELVWKTLIATSKVIVTDKRCFELYGFDIMIDSNLKPWIIQVNGSPSMTANTPVDRQLKMSVLDDTLTLVNVEKLLNGDEQQIGGFDLIYFKTGKFNKPGVKNYSFLGCLNNRHQQLRKMAKTVALRLADKAKEQKAQQLKKQREKDQRQQQRGVTYGNQQQSRHRSTVTKPNFISGNSNKLVPSSNNSNTNNLVNRSNNNNGFGNNNRTATNQSVKLPKVQSTTGSNQMIPTSVQSSNKSKQMTASYGGNDNSSNGNNAKNINGQTHVNLINNQQEKIRTRVVGSGSRDSRRRVI